MFKWIKWFKYFEYWRMNYSFVFVIKNILKLIRTEFILEDICYKFNIMNYMEDFYKKPMKRNRFFTVQELGLLCEDWKIKKGRNYMDYLLKVFNEGENNV